MVINAPSFIFNIELPSKFEANIKIVSDRKLNFKYFYIFSVKASWFTCCITWGFHM